MVFTAPHRSLKLLSFILFCALAASSIHAQDKDLSASYQFQPVLIGAGGWMRGMAVSPSNPNYMYARGDVDNVYRWDNTAQQWYPSKISTAFPAAFTAAPAGGGGGAIAIDPSNPLHVLVVWTLGGGTDVNNAWGLNVYYSTDGANTYQPANLSLNGNLSQETTGERLAIDPNNGNIAYLGPPGAQGATDGLELSLDGGQTWNQVTGGGLPVTNVNTVRYEFQLPRIDGGSGTVTLPGGQTASQIVYVTYIKHDETNSDAILGGGVLKSADGGQTWTDITGTVLETGTDTVGFATIDSAGNLWIADGGNSSTGASSNNLYKWTRTGTAWITSAPTYGGGGGIAVDPTNPQRIFALGNSSMSRSLNGGASWTDLGPMQFASNQTIEWLDPSSFRPQGHYVSVSGLYSNSDEVLFVAGANDGIMTYTPSNTDTSTTWTSISEGIEEMVSQPSMIPPGGRPVLAFEDETLFTIDNPATYTAAHFPIDLFQDGNDGLSIATDTSYAPNQPLYVVVASDNLGAGNPLLQSSEFSSYSADGGNTWTLFPSISAGTHPCLLYGGSIAVSARRTGQENAAPGSDNLVWIPSNFNLWNIFGQGPAPFYSKDGGATWTQTASFNHAPGAITVQAPANCPGPASYTFMGFQWGPWIFALTQHLLVADPVTPGTFYAELTAGGFWTSTDGGVTWTQLQTSSGGQVPDFPHHGTMAAVPGVSGDLWLVDGKDGSDQHGLYHTTNGGVAWTRNPNFTYAWTLALGRSVTSGGYPAIYVYGLLAGDPDWGVFQSIDGGNTFNRISYYPDQLLDVPDTMTASWDTFGTVYIGFQGNSFVYGYYNNASIVAGAPTLSAVAGDTRIILSWQTAYPGGTPAGFNIYRGTAPGGEPPTPIASNINANTYTDTGLTDGTTYYFTVYGVNVAGTGPSSNEASATPAAVSDFTLTNTGSTSAQVLAGVTAKGYSFTVAPRTGSTFGATVTFACSGLDASASCVFNPASIPAGTSGVHAVPVILTITTAGPNATSGQIRQGSNSNAKRHKRTDNRSPWLPLALPIAGVAMLGLFGRKVYKHSVILGLCVAMGLLALLIACGGSSTPISVAIRPTTASLWPNDSADAWPAQTQTFTASVSNNSTVAWSVSPANGGSIDASGNYTAPQVASGLPSSATVTATLVADSTKSASAVVTLKPATIPALYRVTVTATALSSTHQLPELTLVVQ